MNDSKNGDNGTNGKPSDPKKEPKPGYVNPDLSKILSTLENGINISLKNLEIEDEEFNLEGTSDGSNGQYKRRPFKYDHPLWNIGWTDGRLGQPMETNEAVLRSYHQLGWLKRVELIESNLWRNKSKAKHIQIKHDKLKDRLTFAQLHFDEIWRKRIGGYYEFSYVLAGIFLFVAFILFLSDVPLSLRLVAKGFDLKTQALGSNGLTLSVDDIIKNPWQVFSNLWEPVILALGIALAGIFIKFFLDEIIFREESDQEKPRKVKFVLWGVLILFLLTIGLLGWFRASIQAELQQANYESEKVNLQSRLRQQGLPQNDINTIISTLQKPPEEGYLAILTFIGLTIMLPVIGGVCFSAGWRRLKNAHHYGEVKRELRDLEDQENECLERLAFLETEINAQEQMLAREKEVHSLDDPEGELYVNLYRHGYYRGINVPETAEAGENLYTRTKRAVEKIVAKRLRNRIWQDINNP